MTLCLCGAECRLTNGAEVYPRSPHLADKPVWKCTECPDSTTGCHPGKTIPLGYAANKETRKARMILHNRMLDPLWRGVRKDKSLPASIRKGCRFRVYRFLAHHMQIDVDETHVGMFTLDQCRQAWRVLKGQTPTTIYEWSREMRINGKEG